MAGAWTRAEGKNPEGGLNAKGRASLSDGQGTVLAGDEAEERLAALIGSPMAGAGKEFTNPGIDLKDFIGTSFTTAPDGKLYQLPDQQFANLYWFRKDWFDRADLQENVDRLVLQPVGLGRAQRGERHAAAPVRLAGLHGHERLVLAGIAGDHLELELQHLILQPREESGRR